MPIAPKPFKLVCPKCKYTTIVKPKSDTDMIEIMTSRTCPKCGTAMKKKELSEPWEMLKSLLWR